MGKIFCVNLFADFFSSEIDMKSWNDYMAPELLRDFLNLKNVAAEYVNLNELFIKTFFSKRFNSEFLKYIKKSISDFEEKEKLENEELTKYLSLKFLVESINKIESGNILDSVNGSVDYLPPLAFLLMDEINIVQSGEIKVFCDDVDFLRRVSNFDRVMRVVLDGLDLDNSLLVFSVPARVHFNSAIQTGRLIKEMFPTAKIVIGGSYVKLVSSSLLDEMVEKNIIDFYIKDADEGKLLSLTREFVAGNISGFRGDYRKCEKISINDLKRTKKSFFSRQMLLLSRGCYWGKCAFCAFPPVNKQFLIKRADVMVDEIEYFYKMGVTDFSLITDCLIPSVGVAIAKEIIRRDIKIKWDSVFMRIDSGFTKDVFLLLKESGFNFENVTIGMESSIDSVLKFINKGYDKKIIDNFVNAAREAEIFFLCFNVIYDLPGANLDESKQMRDFVLDIYDVTRGIGGVPMYLSEDADMGMHPEKYGIKIVGKNKVMTEVDSLIFTFENDLPADEKLALGKFFSYLGGLFLGCVIYKKLDASLLAHTKIYTEKDFRLMVKTSEDLFHINSLFNENGEREEMNLAIPKKLYLLVSDELFMLKQLNKLKPNTWYSVGEIANILGYSSKFEKLRLMQKIFYSSIVLLAFRGFADAKTDKIMRAI